MDGNNLEVLVDENILWPNGLAFDMPSNRLFWGDAYYDVLESIRLDGTGRHSWKPAETLKSLHPFSISVFQNTIYWTDSNTLDIHASEKFTGKYQISFITLFSTFIRETCVSCREK